jgi:uncharacterized RDD family membrane protein YckC
MTTMTHALPDPFSQSEFYADIPVKRFFAWLVDATLIFLICLIALPFTAFLGLFFFPLMWLFLGFLYRWTTIANGSATWGMRLVAIELRGPTGARLDAGTAFAHTLIYTVAMGTFVLQLLSVALILVSARRQSLADHLLGTVAINRAAAH